MLMVNRYADEAEANSFQRAEELRPKGESRRSAPKLAAEGDHAGAAIWRRITVAIEQLTDTTTPETDDANLARTDPYECHGNRQGTARFRMLG
jgi:hypothetical protein